MARGGGGQYYSKSYPWGQRSNPETRRHLADVFPPPGAGRQDSEAIRVHGPVAVPSSGPERRAQTGPLLPHFLSLERMSSLCQRHDGGGNKKERAAQTTGGGGKRCAVEILRHVAFWETKASIRTGALICQDLSGWCNRCDGCRQAQLQKYTHRRKKAEPRTPTPQGSAARPCVCDPLPAALL